MQKKFNLIVDYIGPSVVIASKPESTDFFLTFKKKTFPRVRVGETVRITMEVGYGTNGTGEQTTEEDTEGD